eukprot:COSAG02_NODE_644_length_18993_cov_6.626389_24_plen_57_part_00
MLRGQKSMSRAKMSKCGLLFAVLLQAHLATRPAAATAVVAAPLGETVQLRGGVTMP